MYIGRGQAQIREETIGHRLVVMLPSVYQQMFNLEVRMLFIAVMSSPDDRCNLHEVRARTYNREDF